MVVEGKANVNRKDTGDITPYENMVLESGDNVSLDTGKLTIKADEDKYVHLEENTEIELKATGDEKKGKIAIELKKGAITNDIQNKLSNDSYYEINTPNSTMSVRGTMFRVWIYEIDGVKYTKISVFEGKVSTRLVYKDGTVSDKEVVVEGGKEVIIYEDGTTTDYLSDPTDIDYSQLPDSVLTLLDYTIETEDRDVSITQEEIKRILEGPYIVKFMYNGNEFGRQTVNKGDTASVPKLKPASGGNWDFDFGEPIERDTVIEWK